MKHKLREKSVGYAKYRTKENNLGYMEFYTP